MPDAFLPYGASSYHFNTHKILLMKKILLSISVLFILINYASGQAYEGTVEYDKKKQRAFIAEYPFPSEEVEAAIVERLEKSGHKAKEEKGLFNSDKGAKVYKNEYIDEINPDRMDYVIKVERKSKKESDKSIVYMIMLKDGVNNIENLDLDGMDKAKSFLNNMPPYLEATHLEFKIKDQEDLLAKSEKKLKKLKEDKDDMEDKIKKLQQNLEDNAKQQENTEKDLEKQRQLLDELKAKRSS